MKEKTDTLIINSYRKRIVWVIASFLFVKTRLKVIRKNKQKLLNVTLNGF